MSLPRRLKAGPLSLEEEEKRRVFIGRISSSSPQAPGWSIMGGWGGESSEEEGSSERGETERGGSG